MVDREIHQRFLGLYPFVLIELIDDTGRVDLHGTPAECRQMVRWAKRSLRRAIKNKRRSDKARKKRQRAQDR